jgi:hypothetical protein
MGWSLGVVALVLKSGLIAPSVSPPINIQDPLALSVAELKQAESFKAAAVGIAGVTPNEVLAWRVVFSSPERDEIFRDLLANGSPSGRLYALAGLWFGDANEFVTAAMALRAQGGTVTTVRGCIASTESVGELVHQIEGGSWSREFLTAGRLFNVR